MSQFSGNKLVLSVFAPSVILGANAILSIRCVESGTLWQITTKRGNCRSRIIVSFKVCFTSQHAIAEYQLRSCSSFKPVPYLTINVPGGKNYFCRQKPFLPVRFLPWKKTFFSIEWQKLANPAKDRLQSHRSTSPCYNPTDPIVPKSTNESRVADLVTDLVADLLVS